MWNNKGIFRNSLWIFHFFRNFSETKKNSDFLGILGTLDSLQVRIIKHIKFTEG